MKTIIINTNENEKLTLATMAEQVENQTGESISVNSFGTFADFVSYFRQHYAPMLQRVQDGTQTEADTHLMRFLADDLLNTFAEV